MKKVLHENAKLSGHILIRSDSFFTHVVEFTPINRSFVHIRSWNASSNILCLTDNCVLVSSHKIKTAAGRDLWRDMRKLGYRVWIDEQLKES